MYKKASKQREFMRDRYRLQYWIDDAFRMAEAQRKSDWYFANRDRINESRRERAAAQKLAQKRKKKA